jgi:F-type H+-transporting ATPase subunit delta
MSKQKTSLLHSYSRALYDILVEEKQDLHQALTVLKEIFSLGSQSADLKVILKDPFVGSLFKINLLYKLCPALEKQATLKKMLCLLSDKRKTSLILELAPEFEVLVNQEDKLSEIKVISAAPLTENQRDTLQKTLETALKNKVKITASVDKSLIAGLIVQSDQYILDNTAKSRLAKLQRHLMISNN